MGKEQKKGKGEKSKPEKAGLTISKEDRLKKRENRMAFYGIKRSDNTILETEETFGSGNLGLTTVFKSYCNDCDWKSRNWVDRSTAVSEGEAHEDRFEGHLTSLYSKG